MNRKPTFSQLQKYNMNQKVLEVLADAQARAILFSTIKEGKTSLDLFDEHRIPLSTIYKKISTLEEIGLLIIEKYVISDQGRRFKVYKSKINGANIAIRSLDPTINLSPN
jgi:predicted transcriptional regulator